MTFEANIGQQVSLPFVSKDGTTGQAGSFVVVVLRDGTTISQAASVTDIGGGAYNVTITFSQAGNYVIITDDQVIGRVLVYNTGTRTMLTSILDATMGSWTWDKVSGEYILYGINGQVVATFRVQDSVSNTSRQRIS